MDQAFSPPDTEEAPSSALTRVLVAWLLAFAISGTVVGASAQVLGVSGSAVPAAAMGAGLGLLLGGVAFAADRRLAVRRPALLDGAGRRVRPIGTWVYAAPLAIAVLALLALSVVGAVHAGSPAFALGAGIAAVGLAAAARPLLAGHWLTAAVGALERDEDQAARAGLLALADGWWVPAGLRAQASLHLGLLALRNGDLHMAARWYARPARGRAAAFAQTGLALVHVLRGEPGPAQAALRRAASGGFGALVQGEADGVRLLMVLREEGPAAAQELGERLLDDQAGGLFCAVLAVARARGGDLAGAQALMAGGLGEALRQARLAASVPEVDEALAVAA